MREDPLLLRQETANDLEGIFEVNRIAFGRDNEAELIHALRSDPSVFVPALSIVAIKDNRIVGHILFTKIAIQDAKGGMHESLALAPMAVSPELQGTGIGARLIRKGLETARRLKFRSVVVLGHETYYPKFGFEPAMKWNITPPFEVPPPAFMAIELEVDGLKHTAGTVIYPEAFGRV